jgi:hypothetical protein
VTGHQLDESTLGLGEAGIVPRCVCGGEWLRGQCVFDGTMIGASWEYTQACREFGRAIVEAFRIRQLVEAISRRCRW